MKRIFSRGLNYHGQCGLGNNIYHSMEKFTELQIKLPITNVYTNVAHTCALGEDGKSIYYWGFNWDIRSFLRTTMLVNTVPNFMKLMKNVWPPLKTFPSSPTLLHKFNHKIVDISMGGGHCVFLDENGFAFTIGENTVGQTGTADLVPLFVPHKVNFMDNFKVDRISAGFQHSIFLSSVGEIYGCGKSDKYQLGEEYLKAYNEAKSFKDYGMGVKRIKMNGIPINEKIIDAKAGKYHSVFLTDEGNVYVIGVNRFGQLGHSNLNLSKTSDPIKLEFPKAVKIVKLECGDNHNLMLADDGTIYANGDNSVGQIDGNLENFLYYNCTPKEIELPTKSKITRIQAKNNRSAAFLENGEVYYWGGFSYHPDFTINNQPKYVGFNKFNNEPGIPENSKILDVALGLFHDLVLIE